MNHSFNERFSDIQKGGCAYFLCATSKTQTFNKSRKRKKGRFCGIFRKICPRKPGSVVQVLPKGRFWEMISFEFHLEKWHEKTQEPLRLLGFWHRYLFRCYLLAKNPNNDTTGFGCTPFYRWGAFSVCGVYFQFVGCIFSLWGAFHLSDVRLPVIIWQLSDNISMFDVPGNYVAFIQ